MLQPSELQAQDLCDAAWVEGASPGTNRRAVPCAVAKVEGHGLQSCLSLQSFFAWNIHVRLPFHVCCHWDARVASVAGSRHQLLGIIFFTFIIYPLKVGHSLLLLL